jgi:hypothetical protein
MDPLSDNGCEQLHMVMALGMVLTFVVFPLALTLHWRPEWRGRVRVLLPAVFLGGIALYIAAWIAGGLGGCGASWRE